MADFASERFRHGMKGFREEARHFLVPVANNHQRDEQWLEQVVAMRRHTLASVTARGYADLGRPPCGYC